MRELRNVGKFEPQDDKERMKKLERKLIKIQTEAFHRKKAVCYWIECSKMT